MKYDSFIIAGPTASGKSDFAHNLAVRTGGVIINIDSVQIYRGIENISASPFAPATSHLKPYTSIEGVPYKLFSVKELTEQISVVDYLELARAEFDAAINAGKVPIFVGGTGFYINAVVNGISPIPEISEDSRNRARDMVRDYPQPARQLLRGADLDFAASDPQRMARALEVFLQTGRPISEWQSLPRTGAIKMKPLKILVNPHRDILKARIEKRIPEMLSGGAMDEAHRVIAAGWDTERAIGASELVKLIKGEIDEKTAIENWKNRTNQYAKRQRTWFIHQYGADIEIGHIPTDKDVDKLIIDNS